MTDKLVAIFISIGILLQGWCVRRVVGTWGAPACVYSIFWFLYTFVPLILVPGAPVEPLAVLYIFIGAALFSASALLFDWNVALRLNAQKAASSPIYSSAIFRNLFYTLSVTSVLLLVVNSYRQGISLHDIAFNMFESAAQYAKRRYSDELDSNVFARAAIVCSYLAVTMGGGGYFHARGALRRASIIGAAFAPSVFVMLTQSSRGMLFLAAALFFGSFAAAKICAGRLSLVEAGTLGRLCLFILVAVPLVSLSFMAKGLYGSGDLGYVVEQLVYRLSSYTAGHLYAFSDWYTFTLGGVSVNQYDPVAQTNGFYTFMAIFRWLGDWREIPQGTYDEYFSYGGQITSNIYTMFRGLILDFGKVGGLLYILISGVVFHAAFYIMLKLRRPVVSITLYIYMYGYLYSSGFISILVYNSIYLGFGALVVLLLYARFCAGRDATYG